MEWLLADAKNKLSELVTRAITEGPQKIRRRKDRVVLVSQHDYDQLTGKKHSFANFLLTQTPDLSDMEFTRDKSAMRNIKL